MDAEFLCDLLIAVGSGLVCCPNRVVGGQLRGQAFQKPYLRRWLDFIGITDIHEISIAPTLADSEALALTKGKAKAAAIKFAATF
jgi:hypothetical protein